MLTARQAEVLAELERGLSCCRGLYGYGGMKKTSYELSYQCKSRKRKVNYNTARSLIKRGFVVEKSGCECEGTIWPTRHTVSPAGREALAEWKKNKGKS